MQRRRFIKIMATSVAGLSLGQCLSARSLQPVRWQGYALGAEGQFTLYTEQPAKAQRVLDACFAEIRRLESLFSLYDDQSELCQLNRTGRLRQPSPDWQPLLRAIDHAHHLTGGLFDPTVQPLWQAYDAHFKAEPESRRMDDAARLSALESVGWEQVTHSPREIRMPAPMSLTLNGIAQGYITDRIADILQSAGYGKVLIELGETRALGSHPEGRPWQIGIQDADDRSQFAEVTELDNQALATSGGYGSPFSQDGRHHHLIHPKTGLPSSRWKSLSVIAPTATEADALSTGLSFAGEAKLETLQTTRPDLRILFQK